MNPDGDEHIVTVGECRVAYGPRCSRLSVADWSRARDSDRSSLVEIPSHYKSGVSASALENVSNRQTFTMSITCNKLSPIDGRFVWLGLRSSLVQ